MIYLINEVRMEKAEQRTKTLEAVRWLAPLPALVIYIATNGVFADWISIILVLGFLLGFSGICNAEKRLGKHSKRYKKRPE